MKIALVMCLMLLLASCEHKPLVFPDFGLVKLRLVFDWSDAPEASPQGMCVFFYPADGSGNAPRRFDFKGRDGGELSLPKGRYNLIAYNNDTEYTLFSSTGTYESHLAYTRPADLFEPVDATAGTAPRPAGTEQQRVRACPDELWGCHAIEIEVTEQGVSYLHFPFDEDAPWLSLAPTITEHVITLYPHDMLCLYSYEVRNVKNLHSVSKMCASLSGMAPALVMADESLNSEPMTLPFEARVSGQSTIVGRFLTFGHHELNAEPHRFALYVWTTDGKRLFFGNEARFNVTQQIHSAPNRRRVHFIIDGLDLPEPDNPVSPGSGLAPSADDWGEINKDIYM